MKQVLVFLAEGFEEIEAVTPVDLLRRLDIDCRFVSLTDSLSVTGAHQITFLADELFDPEAAKKADALVLPGGMPGTLHLQKHAGLTALLREFDAEQKIIGAICAAPMILGEMGLLAGRKATIYPGMEAHLKDATPDQSSVISDGHFVTSRGPGTATAFALRLARLLVGSEGEHKLMEEIVSS